MEHCIAYHACVRRFFSHGSFLQCVARRLSKVTEVVSVQTVAAASNLGKKVGMP